MSRKPPPILWEPDAALALGTRLREYMAWLADGRGPRTASYDELWRWSIADLEAFWSSIAAYFDVRFEQPPDAVLGSREMPGAQWFDGATLSYPEHAFRGRRGGDPPCVRAAGAEHDAFFAVAGLGAIWTSCSPDFGARSVIDRFAQIEPKVLLAVDGYRYGGRDFDRAAAVGEIHAAVGGRLVRFGYLDGSGFEDGFLAAAGDDAQPTLASVAFEHPLWVLYSSGTTGLPKAIVHSHGGILLEQLKKLNLHLDAQPGDRVFWLTTTGWMMWNVLVGMLLTLASVVLYDGSPASPSLDRLWDLAAEAGVTCFGAGAAYISSCMKAAVRPARARDLSALRSVGSTGSPLSPEGFRWISDELRSDAWLFSTSVGTDVCTGFLGGVPIEPVYEGELQGPSLACAAYFEMYPGVWRHGDWIEITSRGTAVIHGRSDATINRGGVRMGTAEIYRTVLALESIVDALAIDLVRAGEESWMALFVVLREGVQLDAELRGALAQRIRADCSPRHVPDEVFAVAEVPRTLSGKLLEVPVRRILPGRRPSWSPAATRSPTRRRWTGSSSLLGGGHSSGREHGARPGNVTTPPTVEHR